VIFHLAVQSEWDAARAAGIYDRSTLGRSLAEEGFIHCSFAGQVATIASRFYASRDDVVVLEIDEDRVGAEIRVELAPDTDEQFPHIYGPLPVAAVVDVQPLAGFLARSR
jgi:uncharacterized protein (DUF952 family)